MTSQFPTPPADATRLLLVLDAPTGTEDAEALLPLLTSYAPVVVVCEHDAAFAARFAREMGASLEADARLSNRGRDERAAFSAVESRIAQHAGGCVLVVAGEAAVRALVCEALGVPLASGWRVRLEAGAVTVAEVGADGRWALVRLNERGGLPAG